MIKTVKCLECPDCEKLIDADNAIPVTGWLCPICEEICSTEKEAEYHCYIEETNE